MASQSEIRPRSRLGAMAQGFYRAIGWAEPTRPAEGEGENARFGEYTLGEKLGEGGMGVVYRANHRMLRRPAAIKLLPAKRAGEKNVERFEREVQLTSQLTHPNTIGIYDFGRAADGTFYYAMEYIDGIDLQTLVERDGPQDPARVTHLLAQVAAALSEAHAAGLVHRDVKPANLMVCDRGGARDVVKVLDFGLIREVTSDPSDRDTDDEGGVVGTPLYMAPEAITSPGSVDARSDVYAIGAVGYFLLTGVPPFSGESVVEVCSQHLYSEPVSPSKRRGTPIPRDLEQLLLRCLAKAPEERPANAAELWNELRRVAPTTPYYGVSAGALAA
ncbi:MAG TPA: serine/threonine-protein kinase [Polyangiaceae bacterium]|nr:serine/threonine-protein kinase [Polyangiaceae bacterium]